jgi:hypothetical protein
MNPKTGNSGKYAEEIVKPITPSEWDKQNLSKGYLPHPGYSTGKRKAELYKEYYNPSVFVPTLTGGGYQWKNVQDPNFDFTKASPVMRYEAPAPKPIVEVNPNTKPIQFTPTSTYNPNTGITTSLEGKILDIEEVPIAAKKKGGLVSKLKGYANGGAVDEFSNMDGSNPNLINAISAGANIVAPGSGALISGGTQLKDGLVNSLSQIDPETGKYKDKRSANTAGLINAAYNTTPLGMLQTAIDPNKNIGEKALSIGTLGISDVFNSKKNVSDLEAKNMAAVEAKKKEEQKVQNDAIFQTNLAKQLAQRSGYNEGGKVVGKGTGTSDSIKATIEDDSYIIPAKNAPIAKEIRKKILGKNPNDKAKLKQPGGTDIKISNGEVVFTPEEVVEIEANGIDLDALAPEAKDKLRNHLNCGGKVKGYADGGEIDSDPPTQKEIDAILVGKKNQDLKRIKGLLESRRKILADKDPKNKYYNESALKSIEDQLKTLNATYNTDKKQAPAKTGAEIDKTVNPKPTGTGLAAKVAPKAPTTAQESLDRTMANQDADAAVVPPLANKVLPPKNAIDTASTLTDPNLDAYNRDLAVRESELGANTANKNANIMDGLSTAVNYGLPLVQAGIGLNFLKKSGPRPVDQIDPIFNQTLERANQRATYGFTPEEQTYLNNQNNNLLASQRFAARNYSGGSPGNAYAMERNAINDSYGRGLASALQNRNLQLSKRQYADELGLNRVELSRRLFNDKMNAWQQNQQAGSQLLGKGIDNFIGANRYEQEKRASDDRSKMENSWLNSI